MDDSGGSLRWLMEAIARLPTREADEALGAGTMVGRYRLIERIGRGGFGVVYRATDTELGRDVALKLLHADGKSSGAPVLLREAQAMARLQHPHIVTVYDVGTLADGQLFVAMELVDGASLRRWLDEAARSTREIVGVFIDAALGLAAAHEAGVVHRDFKADNVLVGRDGVARVADFGLASSPSPSSDVGATGGGTPRYMPLEQVAGAAADARMDQFSFAVALWEALSGSHPFGDGSLVEQRANMENGALEPPRRPLPPWLRAVLTRALATDPAQRFPALRDLVAELRRDPAVHRRRWLVAGATLLVVMAVTVGVWRVERARSLVCKGAARKLEGVWDPARRDAVRVAFLATGQPYAARVFGRVATALDQYAEAFVADHTRACEATQLRGEQSVTVEDLRIACLDQRLRELDALVDLFSSADGKVLDRAVGATAKLTAIGRCDDIESLTSPIAPPRDADTRQRIAGVRKDLAVVTESVDVGRVPQALPVAEGAVPKARAIGWPPLVADAIILLGRARWFGGDFHGAESTLEDAVWSAEAARDDEGVARAAVWLASISGTLLHHHADGRRWGRLALAAAQRIKSERLERDAELYLGRVDKDEAHFADARAHLERALSMTERLNDKKTRLPMILSDLGGINEAESHYDEALAQYQRCLQLATEANPDSLDVVVSNEDIARILARRHDLVAAEVAFLGATALRESRNPADPDIAENLSALAVIAYGLGHFDEAIARSRRAIAIFTRTNGPRNRDIATELSAIGQSLLRLKRFTEARTMFAESLAMFEEAGAKNHPDEIAALLGAAWVEARSGQWSSADKLNQRALAIAATLGPVNDYTAEALVDIAQMKLVAKRPPPSALADAQRALAITTQINGAGSPPTLEPLRAIGEAELAANHGDQALDALTRALKIAETHVTAADDRTELTKLVARAQGVAH